MKFDDFKYFLRWTIKHGSDEKYQVRVIQILLDNNGKDTKQKSSTKISSDLNFDQPMSNNHIVYKILEKYKIISIHGDNITLIDYEKFDNKQRMILVQICKEIISKKFDLNALFEEFLYWLEFPDKIKYDEYMKKQSDEIKNLLREFHNASDSDSKKQISKKLVLNPTLHTYDKNFNTKFIGILDKFVNAQNSELNFSSYTEKIEINSDLVESITPTLSYLNDKFPIINYRMRIAYNMLSDKFSFNLGYLQSIDFKKNKQAWNQLLNKVKNKITDKNLSIQKLQMFCLWHLLFIVFPAPSSATWSHLKWLNYSVPSKHIREKNGFVIFLDVLGTKNAFKDDNSNTYVKKWLEIIDNAKQYFAAHRYPTLQNMLKFSYLSDTVIITAEYDVQKVNFNNPNDKQHFFDYLNNLCYALVRFMFIAMSHEIFFRGCISYGNYFSNDYTSFGKAVVEAGTYHELPKWIGVSAAPSLYNILYKNNSNSYFRNYNIPTNFGIEIGYALDLEKIWHECNNNESGLLHKLFKDKLGLPNISLIDLLKKQLEKYKDYDISIKYRNTIEFIFYTKNMSKGP